MARKLSFHTASRAQRKRNSSRRYIACEIEIADSADGYAINNAAADWKCSVVEDGSLPDTGFELVSAPASGDLFLEQIEELCGALNDDGASVDASCGLHVHVDARDFRYWDIRRLIRLYAKVEDALFRLVPPSRRRSGFCVPCAADYLRAVVSTAPKAAKDGLLCELYGSAERTRYTKADKYQQCRYRALNLHSWLYRGTVEFRLGAGSTDARKITHWALVCCAVVDYAAQHSDREVDALKGAPMDVLKRITPSALHPWIAERDAKLNSVGV